MYELGEDRGDERSLFWRGAPMGELVYRRGRWVLDKKAADFYGEATERASPEDILEEMNRETRRWNPRGGNRRGSRRGKRA